MEKNQIIYCLFESVYSEHISKRNSYEVTDEKEDKVRIKNNNGKLVWIAFCGFVNDLTLIPFVKSIQIAAENWLPGEWNPDDDNTDVIVCLDDALNGIK